MPKQRQRRRVGGVGVGGGLGFLVLGFRVFGFGV